MTPSQSRTRAGTAWIDNARLARLGADPEDDEDLLDAPELNLCGRVTPHGAT
jgi:hypothetical protein